MATPQRAPRDILLDADAEYQRLAEQHSKYDEELHRISNAPYLSSEDLLEEIKLKKMKLHCKDKMERIALRIQRSRAQYTQ
ncbi:MAG TPA: YdcH family protein [Candidatus Acidoferrum sp.]|nr:YdcH family protein [Candidatus Acidoferrum sp.]